jgi:hypothetical protein
MLICCREFTVAEARMELPADVAGVRTDPTQKPLDLSL